MLYIDEAGKKNETTRVSAENFLGLRGETLFYADENGKEKRLALEKNAALLLNLAPAQALAPFASGSVLCVDSDGDGLIEAVFAEKYETFVVESVGAQNFEIYLK